MWEEIDHALQAIFLLPISDVPEEQIENRDGVIKKDCQHDQHSEPVEEMKPFPFRLDDLPVF